MKGKRNQGLLVKKNLITANADIWCFVSSLILSGLFALGVNQLKAEYIYENLSISLIQFIQCKLKLH